MLKALDGALALVQFDAAGRITHSNKRFLAVSGQDAGWLKGRHFAQVFEDLTLQEQDGVFCFGSVSRGQRQSAHVRLACGTRGDRWLHVVFAPLDQPAGGVVASVTDVTDAKSRSFADECKITALDRSQAVVEFDLQGTILQANGRFCDVFGYRQAELEGRHHSILVDAVYRDSPEYAEFWNTLRRGEYHCGEYRRVAEDGRTVWIQASYNPVLDSAGRPSRVVKFASDTTKAKLLALENDAKIAAIGRSQGVIEFSVDGTILEANANFLRMTGYALNEIRGRHHRIFVPLAERDGPAYRTFWENLRQGRFQAAEYRRIGRDGQEVWIQATYNPVFDLDGRLIKIIKFATDVTGPVKQREQMHRLSLVADQTGHSVVMTDLDGRIDYVNAGFTRMTGYSFAEVRGRRPGDVLQGPLTNPATRARLSDSISRQQPVQEEILNYTKAGEPYWISLFINLVTDENGIVRRFFSIQTDITQRRKLEERATFLAQHDALTGLANRMLFHERLRDGLNNRTTSALIYLDLDRFKQVNDTLGHPAGDALLQQVASRLLACVRVADTVARLGGDEFAIIYTDVDKFSDVRTAAERIIERVAEPYEIANANVTIGITIGIAITDPDLSPEQMVDRADRALYRAKQAGRGCFKVFSDSLQLAL